MSAPRFRPELAPLEDRTTPAVSPTEVFAALAEADQVRAILSPLAARQPFQFNSFTQQFLRQYLPTLTVESQRAAAVLGEYQNALADEAATNPAAAPLVARIGAARFQAEVNALYAAALTTGFGGTAIQVLPPLTAAAPTPVRLTPVFDGSATDPNTPPVVPPVTPEVPVATDFTTDAGTTAVIPPLDAPQWVARANGLRTWDVIQGVGTPLAATSTGLFYYSGYLVDGTEFDGTPAGGDPVEFSLPGTIQGFQQGLVGLQPGGVRRIDIPAELGYGAAGFPPDVPANARLIFEVKLVNAA